MKRRKFIKTLSATGFGLAAARSPLFALRGSPNERVVVAIMGLNGRGSVLGKVFAQTPNAEVAYVCDVDAAVLAKGVSTVGAAQGGGGCRVSRGGGVSRAALSTQTQTCHVSAATGR